MRYMLDTNICIYLIRQQPPEVLARLETLYRGDAVMSVVTQAELRAGIEMHPASKIQNEHALSALLEDIPALPFDQNAAEKYGVLRAAVRDRSRNALDRLIAAHALALDLTLVTNNEQDFSCYPNLRVENWVNRLQETTAIYTTDSKIIIHYTTGLCSLGTVLVAQNERGICAILLDDNAVALTQDLQQRFPDAELIDSTAILQPLLKKVTNFIAAPENKTEFPLDLDGTDFQKKVWQALRKIPAGKTATYTDIANSIGSPSAVRAVASACAANPVAVVVPCHRVLRRDGGLSGYRWGIERKRALLQREAE